MRETSVGDFYRKLQQAARTASANGFPLLIFPSTCDADALCAYKIVTRLLESDSICHSVYPVAGFSSIQTLAGKAVRSNDDPVVLLLINWGASRNLHRLLELGSQVQVFVVDSHRPIHLHNLSAKNTQVTMLFTRDDEIQAGMTASSILNEVSSFSNTYDSEPELELEDDDSDEEFASDDDGEAERIKRRRQGGLELQRQEQRKKAEYYRSGCFHGRPAGCLMFDIAHSLHKNNNELLWLACVALTDQFVHERITAERYNVTAIELEGHVSSAGNAEKVTSVTLRDGTKVRAPDVSRIVSDDEPRLMLLREWSLYDAMMNSFFVAPKLKTWGDAGLRTMKLLFAKMGISLAECQQSFRYMSSETKKGLKEEFEKLEKTVFSGKLYFRNFHKYHGYGNQVSAADVVYGVSALLEAAGSDETSDYTDNFCKAVRALSPNEWQTLQSGMQLAIQVQRACISIGSAAILKKDEIKMSKAFRWAVFVFFLLISIRYKLSCLEVVLLQWNL